MAGINIVSKSSDSVTLNIANLDTTWNGDTRTVYWYLGSPNGGIPTASAYSHKGTTSINGAPSTGGQITFYNLEPSSTYQIYCAIYHTSISRLLAELYGSFTTDKASSSGGVPDVASITYETTPGSREIVVIIEGENITGYTLTLNLSYSDGTSRTSKEVQITSDYFSTTITASGYATNRLAVGFDVGGDYAYVRTFDVTLEQGEDGDYFEWSSAVKKGSPIKNVSHTEWDDFIDKIKEVLTDKGKISQPLTSEKYGYAVGTTYKTMLNDCYMSYDTSLSGYPLTAKKFNVARFIIGSNLPNGGTTGMGDKEAKSSKVLASDFITLANCLKEIQG